MPPRPANNYIVQWKITGLNILHVETEMPDGHAEGSQISVSFYIYSGTSSSSTYDANFIISWAAVEKL